VTTVYPAAATMIEPNGFGHFLDPARLSFGGLMLV